MAQKGERQAETLRHRVRHRCHGHSGLGHGQGPQDRGDARVSAGVVGQGRGVQEDQGGCEDFEEDGGVEGCGEGVRHEAVPRR